jgi:hypothetical protein
VQSRGVIAMPDLMELNSTHAVAALVEIDFHDNPDGAAWITSHKKEIAIALDTAICKYFNLAIPDTMLPDKPNGTWTAEEIIDWLGEKRGIDTKFWKDSLKYLKNDIVRAVFLKWSNDIK